MPVRIPVALSLLCVAVSAVLLVFPSLGGLDPRLGRGAGAVALGIGLWATGVIPEYLTAIIFFFVALVFSVAAPTVVLAGFYSGAVWLVFGGLVMGTAAQKSGLGDRIAELVLRHLPSSYVGILGVLVLVALVLRFLIPSCIGRLALLIPLVVSLGRQLGFAPGSRGHTGLVMAAGMATIMPSNAILTANVPPIVLAGAAESIFGLKISYLKYLLLNMPVLGAGSAVIIVVLCALMFHQQP
ncbi:MAG: SLC13 family permease, partial [Lysobacterales bacterium]